MSAAEINANMQTVRDRVDHLPMQLLEEGVRQADLGRETSVIQRIATSLGNVVGRLEQEQRVTHAIVSTSTRVGADIETLTKGSTRQDVVNARTQVANIGAGAEAIDTRMNGMADKLISALGHLAAFEEDMEGYAALQGAAATSLEDCHGARASALENLDTFLENPL